MVGVGCAACGGTPCACDRPEWTPPPPAPGPTCEELEFVCEFPPSSFSVRLRAVGVDNPCYINCESCDTTPFDLILNPGVGTWPYLAACAAGFNSPLGDLTEWWNECNDDCVYEDYTGNVTLERDCEFNETEGICDPPPLDGEIATGVSMIMVMLRVFKDGCFKLVVFTATYPGSGGTIKVDPTDPNNTVTDGGCYSLAFFTRTGEVTCCGDASMSGGGSSSPCTDTGDASSGCSGFCTAVLASDALTMNCGGG